MSSGLIEIIKIAAMDAIENSKPSDLKFGTVTSVNPLKVTVNSNFTIPESLLIVPEHLTDYSMVTNVGGEDKPNTTSVNMQVVGETLFINTTIAVSDDEEQIESVDERTLTLYNSLNVGDEVVLLRNQGGSTYLILDRI